MGESKSDLDMGQSNITDELQRLASMMRAFKPDLKEVAGEVTLIEPLASDILSHVNSPVIGLPNHITRVDHAVTLLGQRRTLELIEDRLKTVQRQTEQKLRNARRAST